MLPIVCTFQFASVISYFSVCLFIAILSYTAVSECIFLSVFKFLFISFLCYHVYVSLSLSLHLVQFIFYYFCLLSLGAISFFVDITYLHVYVYVYVHLFSKKARWDQCCCQRNSKANREISNLYSRMTRRMNKERPSEKSERHFLAA